MKGIHKKEYSNTVKKNWVLIASSTGLSRLEEAPMLKATATVFDDGA